MARQFMKGNDAIIVGALAAGCRAYYGYPITPASEIAHAAAQHFPALGGVFIQAESEVAASNMIFGAAGVGVKCLTSSSSPGAASRWKRSRQERLPAHRRRGV